MEYLRAMCYYNNRYYCYIFLMEEKADMAKMTPEAKRKRKEEKKQMKEERQVQSFLRIVHNRDEFGRRNYSTGFFRRNTPEAVEARWRSDIETLKQILRDYEAGVNKKNRDEK